MNATEKITGAWVITTYDGEEVDRIATTKDPDSSGHERAEMGLLRSVDLDRFIVEWVPA